MTIQAQLPDGTTLQFPDGTPDAVVNGAVKQQLNQQPAGAAQTPESKLGLTPAPPEEPKPAAPGPTPAVDEYGRPIDTSGNVWTKPTGPPPQPYTGLPIFPAPAPGAIGRIGQAAAEGFEGGQVLPRGNLWAPVVNPVTGLVGAAFRGGQQFVTEAVPDIHLPSLPPGMSIPLGGGRQISGELTPGSLGREVAAIPEAFPTGPLNTLHPELVQPRPPPFKPTPQFVRSYYGEGTPQNPLASGPNTANMTTAERITNAVRGADQPPGSQPPAPYQPPAFVPPNTSPYPPSAPRAVEAGPRPAGGDVTGYGTPLPSQPTTPTPASRPGFVPPTVQEAATPPAASPPAPDAPPTALGPTSVGAAASREGTPAHMLTLSPTEEKAYRSTAEGQKLLETQQPGIADNRQLVPGVQANSAEIEQTAQAARELKSLKLQSPALSDDAFAAVDANNTARQGFYNGLAGSKVTLQNAIDARAAQADRDLTATWGNKQNVSPQPVLDAVEQMKQTDDWRRPAVRNAVNNVTKELYDDNGNLITDPQLLYGVRKHIDDMLSKEGAATDPLAVRAKANLMQLKNSLDGVISDGAPGFRNYLDNFSTASRPIDTMRVLQDHEVGLYGSQNRMEYARFQRFMKDVVDARSSTGPNPYKSIPDDTMQQLWNMRDDLRRSSAAVELAKTAGSDTAQNLMDLARHGLARGIGATVGGTVGSVLGPIGTGVGASVGAQAGERFVAGRAEQRAYQRGQQMLYPQNQLGPP